MEMPFTEEEFKQEVQSKTLFGIISGLLGAPFMLCESEDAFDLNDLRDNQVEELTINYKEKIVPKIKSNPIFKDRFISIFDDALEKCIIK